MLWSITIGRFGGTEVKIHITFILLLAWIAFSAWARGGPAAALDSTLFIILLFACVVLHEFGHILAARRYGINSPMVTLLPIRLRPASPSHVVDLTYVPRLRRPASARVRASSATGSATG